MDADVRVETIGSVQVITPRIRAEIDPDGDNVWEFYDQVRPLVEVEGSRAVIDLRSSTACDLLMLALIKLHTGARARGGWVVVARPDAPMQECLRICRLDRHLEIFATLDAALLALAPEATRPNPPAKDPACPN